MLIGNNSYFNLPAYYKDAARTSRDVRRNPPGTLTVDSRTQIPQIHSGRSFQ